MDFFINPAWAQAAGGQGDYSFFLMIAVLFGMMYFLIIRPQNKRAKEHKKMVEEITKGQEVVTGGGLLGKVTDVNDTWVTVEVARDISLKVQRGTISSVMPPGTVKNA